MMLKPILKPDTAAQPQTRNERICETIRETTERRGTPVNLRKSRTADRNGLKGSEAQREHTSQQYTPRQRERMEKGLHILARMIARAHLRREASRASQTRREPPSDQ